jgi:hypothetical protein
MLFGATDYCRCKTLRCPAIAPGFSFQKKVITKNGKHNHSRYTEKFSGCLAKLFFVKFVCEAQQEEPQRDADDRSRYPVDATRAAMRAGLRLSANFLAALSAIHKSHQWTTLKLGKFSTARRDSASRNVLSLPHQ